PVGAAGPGLPGAGPRGDGRPDRAVRPRGGRGAPVRAARALSVTGTPGRGDTPTAGVTRAGRSLGALPVSLTRGGGAGRATGGVTLEPSGAIGSGRVLPPPASSSARDPRVGDGAGRGFDARRNHDRAAWGPPGSALRAGRGIRRAGPGGGAGRLRLPARAGGPFLDLAHGVRRHHARARPARAGLAGGDPARPGGARRPLPAGHRVVPVRGRLRTGGPRTPAGAAPGRAVRPGRRAVPAEPVADDRRALVDRRGRVARVGPAHPVHGDRRRGTAAPGRRGGRRRARHRRGDRGARPAGRVGPGPDPAARPMARPPRSGRGGGRPRLAGRPPQGRALDALLVLLPQRSGGLTQGCRGGDLCAAVTAPPHGGFGPPAVLPPRPRGLTRPG